MRRARETRIRPAPYLTCAPGAGAFRPNVIAIINLLALVAVFTESSRMCSRNKNENVGLGTNHHSVDCCVPDQAAILRGRRRCARLGPSRPKKERSRSASLSSFTEAAARVSPRSARGGATRAPRRPRRSRPRVACVRARPRRRRAAGAPRRASAARESPLPPPSSRRRARRSLRGARPRAAARAPLRVDAPRARAPSARAPRAPGASGAAPRQARVRRRGRRGERRAVGEQAAERLGARVDVDREASLEQRRARRVLVSAAARAFATTRSTSWRSSPRLSSSSTRRAASASAPSRGAGRPRAPGRSRGRRGPREHRGLVLAQACARVEEGVDLGARASHDLDLSPTPTPTVCGPSSAPARRPCVPRRPARRPGARAPRRTPRAGRRRARRGPRARPFSRTIRDHGARPQLLADELALGRRVAGEDVVAGLGGGLLKAGVREGLVVAHAVGRDRRAVRP